MHLILKIVGITVPEEKNDSDSGGEKNCRKKCPIL
jgi:hypothetical protein